MAQQRTYIVQYTILNWFFSDIMIVTKIIYDKIYYLQRVFDIIIIMIYVWRKNIRNS